MLVPATKVREVSHMLKAIYAQESRDAADRKARAIVDDLRAARMNTAADLVERSVFRDPDLLRVSRHSLAEDPSDFLQCFFSYRFW